jgi:hypothetical protein
MKSCKIFLKIICCVFPVAGISITFSSCLPGKKFSDWKEKPVHSVYSGGYHWDITLTLYKDSTFRYVVRDDILRIPSVKTGAYLKTDNSITLYRWKSKYISRKSVGEDFRIQGNKVLMFSREKEESADSSFYRAYYTLSLSKSLKE